MKSMLLSGIKALVVRPLEFANELSVAINRQQGFAIPLPMQSCLPLDQATIIKQLNKLTTIDHIIVTSRIAAIHFMPIFKKYCSSFTALNSWHCLGSGTAIELKKFGMQAKYAISGITSEDLLQQDEFQHNIAKKTVLIVKGIGGRNTLQHNLTLRKVNVIIINVYARKNIEYPSYKIRPLINSCNLIICGNHEALLHLCNFITIPERHNFIILLPSIRLVIKAKYLGFYNVHCSYSMNTEKVISALYAIKSTILELKNEQAKI